MHKYRCYDGPMPVAATTETRLLDDRELAAWRDMLVVQKLTLSLLDAELQREHDLTLGSYEVLLQLAEAPGESLRMGELAERILLSRSGLTRLVDRLVARGLVVRNLCERDRRGTYAKLTDAGRGAFEAARPTHMRGVREHFIDRLGEGDLDRLAAAWQRLLRSEG